LQIFKMYGKNYKAEESKASRLEITSRSAMPNPRPACGPVEGFVQPSLGFRCSKSTLWLLTTCPYFDNLQFDIFLQVVLSATLSLMLPLQLGFERFQYISSS